MSTFRVRLTQGTPPTGSGSQDWVGQEQGTISAASNASPIVITSANHGLTTGQKVGIINVGGNTAANGTWVVTVLSSSTFALNGSSGNASYTSGGTWFACSVSRTMVCPGPNGYTRILTDGEIFSDCNYWKKFTTSNLPTSEAFIDLIEDDGIAFSYTTQSVLNRVYTLTVLNDTTFTDEANIADFLTDYGVAATAAVITVSGEDVTMRINGQDTADYPLSDGATFEFSAGEASLTSLAFSNSVSGGSTATVIILATIPSVCNS